MPSIDSNPYNLLINSSKITLVKLAFYSLALIPGKKREEYPNLNEKRSNPKSLVSTLDLKKAVNFDFYSTIFWQIPPKGPRLLV